MFDYDITKDKEMKRKMFLTAVFLMAMMMPVALWAQGGVKILGTKVNGVNGSMKKVEIASTVQLQLPKAAENQYLCAAVFNIGDKWNSPESVDDLGKLMKDYCSGGSMVPAGKGQTQDVDVAINLDFTKIKKTTQSTNIYMQTYVVDTGSKKIVAMSGIDTVDPSALKKDAKKAKEAREARKAKKGEPSMMDKMQAKMFAGFMMSRLPGAGEAGSDGKVGCSDCNGTGRHNHMTVKSQEECSTCKDNVCQTCDGTGRVEAGLFGTVGSSTKEKLNKMGITEEKLTEELLKGR